MSVQEIQSLVIQNPGAGGANEKLAGHLIQDSQSARQDDSTLPLKNCHTDTLGKIVKRKGYTVYAGALTTTSFITGMFQYKMFGGGEFEVVAGDDGFVKHIWDISSPGSPVDIIGAATITSDSLFDFCQVADKLIMTTESRNTPLKWAGSGNVASLGGTPPVGKYCIEFENYGFIANTSSNPERVYWSDLFDPETWGAANFKRLNGACTGLGKADNSLFAFTANSIYVGRYTGDSINPLDWTQLETTVGCKAAHSIITSNGILYWIAGDNHVYKIEGFTPKRVTEAIPVTISNLNSGSLSKAVAVDHKELSQLWFHVPYSAATTNDFVIALDYISNELFFYDGISGNYAANFSDSSGLTKTYFGDRTGRIYLTNTGNSDYVAGVATAIDFYRYSKQFNFGHPNLKKRIRKIKSTSNNHASAITTITVNGDFGASSGEVITLMQDAGDTTIGAFIIGTSILGGVEEIATYNDVATTAKYIQLKFANNQLDIPINFSDLEIEYQLLPGR